MPDQARDDTGLIEEACKWRWDKGLWEALDEPERCERREGVAYALKALRHGAAVLGTSIDSKPPVEAGSPCDILDRIDRLARAMCQAEGEDPDRMLAIGVPAWFAWIRPARAALQERASGEWRFKRS